MPRIARNFVDGCIYHILNRGNSRKVVFHSPEDYEAFLKSLQETKTTFNISILAYCLMPNHFHLLLQPQKAAKLSNFMQRVMIRHIRRYQSLRQTVGHVWQGRYKSFPVQTDGHLLTVVRYIEGNPLRANLAQHAIQWPWSSFAERQNEQSRLLDPLPLDLPANWGEYVETLLPDKDLSRIRRSVNQNLPFGTPTWHRDIARQTKK